MIDSGIDSMKKKGSGEKSLERGKKKDRDRRGDRKMLLAHSEHQEEKSEKMEVEVTNLDLKSEVVPKLNPYRPPRRLSIALHVKI